MNEPLLEKVIRLLEGSRGRWPQIAQGSGVPYFTITNIAQRRVPNPGVQTIQKLLDYFGAEEKERAA